jgi:hypothetical protein
VYGGKSVGEISGLAVERGGGFAAKLRDLETLKKDGLISNDEYQKKRAEIIQETW